MTSPFEQQLLGYARTHVETGILLDTNVLLLLLVARFMPSRIGTERLKAYQPCDADLLIAYVGRFKKILTTAHVLAEVSNLARQMAKGRLQTQFMQWLHPIFCNLGEGSLTHVPMDNLAIDPNLFVRLGLTDAGIAAFANTDKLIFTADLDLHVATLSRGGHSINFTHMREAAGLL